MPTIIEDCTGMDITQEQADYLVELAIIYACPLCGNEFYHISIDHDWDDVPKLLKQMEE